MAAKASAWELGGLTWKELATRVWTEINDDDVFGRAAQLSYYFLLALFPLLIFLTTLLGYFAEAGSELRTNMLEYLGSVVPREAYKLINDTVTEISEGAGGGKLSFGILATLWTASNGMGAISSTLNIAYGVKESRSWWKVRLVAIGLTLALAVLIVTALVLVLYGHDIAEAVANNFGLGAAFTITWKIIQWPIVLAFVLVAFGLIYYFAPDLKDQSWQWVTPGAAVGVALWLLVSFAFNIYLDNFGSYNAAYGSLGAVIILMLWFYLTGAAVLIGGEINSEIESAAAERGAPDAKKEGAKSSKERKSVGLGQKAGTETRNASTANRTAATSTGTTPASRVSRVTLKSDGKRGGFTFRKAIVVFGAWVFSKFRGSSR